MAQLQEKRIDTVLFDFDGTVMDTNEIILKSWEHTFEKLRGEKPDRSMLLSTFGEPLKMTMHNFFGGDEEQVERNIEIYRSYQREHYLDHIRLFPGVYEMLAAVKTAGYKTALVTSRLKPTTYDGVRKFEIGKFFDYIVTADDVTRHKPDPQPAQKALQYLKSSAETAGMLGDTKQDVLCAINAGVTSVLVSWSMALPEEKAVGDLQPDYILKSPEALTDLLASMNGGNRTAPAGRE